MEDGLVKEDVVVVEKASICGGWSDTKPADEQAQLVANKVTLLYIAIAIAIAS